MKLALASVLAESTEEFSLTIWDNTSTVSAYRKIPTGKIRTITFTNARNSPVLRNWRGRGVCGATLSILIIAGSMVQTRILMACCDSFIRRRMILSR